MKLRLATVMLLSAYFLQPIAVHAQWLTNGNGLCIVPNDQTHATIVPDGSGGAIVAWQDLRVRNSDIYAQRVNAFGMVQWTSNGVAVCTATNDQLAQAMVEDGAGGAVIAWEDRRNLNTTGVDIYAQRINSAGVVQWTANGVALCTAAASSDRLTLAPDGTGGAIVTWEDDRNGSNYDIYAQRIDGAGVVQWTTDGVPLCVAALDQQYPKIVSDGTGGAIIVWIDIRNGTAAYVYMQRIDASGAVQWTTDGARLCPNAAQEATPFIASDDAGGAIVMWHDFRNADEDIYAQRINGSAVAQWPTDGVPVCTAPGPQAIGSATSDGAGGAIMAWADGRSSGFYDIYTQRVNASGVNLWTGDGVPVCTAADYQLFPSVVSDGAGGAIIAWQDHRNTTDYDVYAQRVDATGVVQWTTNGVTLCSSANDQTNPVLASDGSFGAIGAWQDFRGGSSYDIYALRVTPDGTIPTGVHNTPRASELTLSPNYPNPFSGETVVDLTLRDEEPVRVEVFDVAGRRVREMDIGRRGAGTSELRFDGMDNHANYLPSGVYFFRVHAGGETVTRKMVIDR